MRLLSNTKFFKIFKIVGGILKKCLRNITTSGSEDTINLNSSELTEMTPQHRATLLNLSQAPTGCRMDTLPAKDVPDDLKPDTYRWFKYVYTNTNKDDLTRDEKVALITTSMILLNIHLITWKRDLMYEVLPDRVQELSLFVGNKISETTCAEVLRILVYLSRMMPSEIYIDDAMVKKIPELLSYTK
jgi:hypothetical protein